MLRSALHALSRQSITATLQGTHYYYVIYITHVTGMDK